MAARRFACAPELPEKLPPRFLNCYTNMAAVDETGEEVQRRFVDFLENYEKADAEPSLYEPPELAKRETPPPVPARTRTAAVAAVAAIAASCWS